MLKFPIFISALLVLLCVLKCEAKKPNIIFIVADDAGFNDFSFHGSTQIPTPNIDAIGINGVILNSYYSSPLCTPSRAATLTGKYPIHLGLQHYVILAGMPTGLPTSEKLLPQYLKELGYGTHLVGKWHLGHARKAFAPTKRGFDSHYGYYLGAHDYYTHECRWRGRTGYDFRKNLTVDYSAFGKYSTDLFTDEAVRIIKDQGTEKPLFLMIAHVAPHSSYKPAALQAPEESVKKFEESIEHEERRKYAGIVSKLDDSVGAVMEALAEKDMLKDSIVIFVSDNGGAAAGYDLNHASNWPLRGMKNTLWEGGTRLAASIWSPQLQRPKVSTSMMHSVDWLPTLVDAAGGDTSCFDELDGVSHWQHLTGKGPAPRHSFLYNIDPVNKNAAVRFNQWKLIQGRTSLDDLGKCPPETCNHWFGPSGRAADAETSRDLRHALLKSIMYSRAGRAFAQSGHPIDPTSGSEQQRGGDISCGGDDDDDDVIDCAAHEAPCLFDIDSDPCERKNVAALKPELVTQLVKLIEEYNKTAIPALDLTDDPDSPPYKNGYLWTFFKDDPFERDGNNERLIESSCPLRSEL